MRRGSIQTWESLARRQSANMTQLASSRSEFMTSDLGLSEIEYERKGGFFMSHKKTAFVVIVFVLIIIAAGFVGAYIGSIPKEKVHDTLELIEADIGCDETVSSKFSLSNSLWPSKYRIELSPIFENKTVTKFRGRVAIEFRYNGSSDLSELVLNARSINVTRVTLTTGIIEKTDDFKSRKKRISVNDVAQTNEHSASMNRENGNSGKIESTANAEILKVAATNSNLANESVGSEAQSMKLKNQSDPTNATDASFSSTTESSVDNKTIEILISKNETDEKGGFLVLYPEKSMVAAEYYLEIDYEIPINGYIFYAVNKRENDSETWMPTSRLRSAKLRNILPVFDDPRMKARFSLTLPRPVSMKIFSNMPLKSTNNSLNGWVMDTFEKTPPISPQNVAIVATRDSKTLGEKIIDNTTVNFYDENLSSGGPTFLMEKIVPVLQSYIELFNVNLSIPKLDIIGLEHSDYNYAYPGLIVIQESLYGVKNNSPEVMKEYALLNLIKLVGRQWLGGLVQTQNSSDVWIVESSLIYFQYYLMEELNSEFNRSTFLMDVQPDVFEVNGYSVSKSLKSNLEPSHTNSFHIHEAYAIGACLIRMLHGALRETEFRAGYGSFISRWFGGNADPTSFWEALTINSTTDEQPEGRTNLAEVMNQWSTIGGYPVITVTRNYETGSAIVHQTRFTYDKLSSATQQLWHIPLTWISNINSQTSPVWIKNQAENTLQIEEAANFTVSNNKTWIVFNPNKSGYYRVNYDEENWKLIAEALRENHEIFSSVTRASIIDDVFSLGFIRSIPYSIVFDIIEYLPENERAPEPWTYLLHHTIKLNLVLYDSPEYSEYQELMIKFISSLFDQAGPQVNKGPRLTMMAHLLACMFDHPAYVVWAKESYADFENLPGLPIKQNVPFYLHKSLLCAFAKLNHQLGWQWWEQKFANVTNREERNSLLSSLACFEVPSMLQAVLNEIVYSESFDTTDALVILESFSIYPAAAQTALKFVESNWKNITKRYSKSCKIAIAFLDAASTGFTAGKDIEDFQSFRDKNYESLKKVGYATGILEAKANASVSFITSLPDNPIIAVNKTTLQDAKKDVVEVSNLNEH